MPTRNRARLLNETLRSVLEQSEVDIEVVVVDEASDDETAVLLSRVGDKRLRVIRHEKPQGVAVARNAGAAHARARWLAFCDDDDLWAAEKLSAQIAAVGKNGGVGWCQVGHVAVNHELAVIGARVPQAEDIYRDLLRSNVVPGGGSGVMVRRDLFEGVGGFDARFSNLADWDLWIRLAARAPIATVQRPLVAWRAHAGMSSNVEGVVRETRLLAEKYRGERLAAGVELDDGLSWRHYLGVQYLRAGRRWAAAGHHCRMAWRYKDMRWLAVAGACVLWPSFQDRRDRRRGAAVPPSWRQDAEDWLAPIRARSHVGPAGDLSVGQ